MFVLIKNADVFSPKPLGKQDILLCGNNIALIGENISLGDLEKSTQIVDASGLTALPGYIDAHVHIIGGGGEAGFSTRTPEVTLSKVTENGITTVVGLLGTDGTTRHMESLLAKARGLEAEGISSYIYSGAYHVPTVTLTDNVRNDVVIIDKVIGCGEVAISDHRSSNPSKEDIAKLVAATRVGGMLSGKAGVLLLHLGDGKDRLKYVTEIIEETEIPVTQIIPTHVNRNKELMAEAIEFAKTGGVIDFTSGISSALGVTKATNASEAVKLSLKEGVDIKNITMSSDGNGSMPLFNDKGEVEGLLVASLDSLHQEFAEMVKTHKIPMEDAVKVITSNPATHLKLPRKGFLKEDFDADVVLLNDKMEIVHVFAKGKHMVKDGKAIVKGVFE